MTDFNSNLRDRIPNIQPENVTAIFTEADFLKSPSASSAGGVLSLTGGLFDIKANINMTDRIEIVGPGAAPGPPTLVTFRADSFLSGVALNFVTPSQTFFTTINGGFMFIIFQNLMVRLGGDNSTMFDIGPSTGALIGESVQFEGTIPGPPPAATGTSVGTVRGFGQVLMQNGPIFGGFTDEGIVWDSNTTMRMDVSINVPPPNANADFVMHRFIGTSGRMNLNQIENEFLNPGQALFDFDPLTVGPVNITQSLSGNGEFFNIIGTTGDIEDFTDLSFSGQTIDDVVDNGSGLAQFNYVGNSLTVGQEVTISGFTGGLTSYNGTFIITAAVVPDNFEIGVSFLGSQTTGLTATNTVAIDSDGNNLDELQLLSIVGSTSYDGRYTIYFSSPNSFAINHVFVSEAAAGIWNTKLEGDITNFETQSFTGIVVNTVNNNGGQAQFIYVAGIDYSVGQTVTLGGFSQGAYNGTFVITATDKLTFIEVGLTHVGTSLGTIDNDSVLVRTITTNALTVLDIVTILNSVNYSGDHTVYNIGDDSFQFDAVFISEILGAKTTWNVGASLTESDPRIDVKSSAPQKDSMTIGALLVSGNTVDTIIPAAQAFIDFDLGGLAFLGPNNERFLIFNTTTGEMQYIGLPPVSVSLTGFISATGQGSAIVYNFRLLQNGAAVIGEIDMPISIGGTTLTFPIEWGFTANNLDKFRLQVSGASQQDLKIETMKFIIQ